MQTTLEILRNMRLTIADEASWTQYAAARDINGSKTDPRGNDAVCWCLMGAMWKFAPDGYVELDIRATIENVTGRFSLAAFNDQHTHAEVIKVVDRAISVLEKKIDQSSNC